ncbi:hypothetical protein LCGC14_2765160 [marine sediment metagenome]|uniref:Uncharacterized protein n=1 Tax=marine sediment metagenome TaxID=412755 RepID=A0A0F9BPC9_9ZZZZ
MVDTGKKTYLLPKKLAKIFGEWCKPGRDYSPKVAGAILVWMTLEPATREQIIDLAYSDNIEKATKKAKDILTNSVVEAATIQEFGSLKEAAEEAQAILEVVRREAKEVSGVKKKR